MGQENERKWEEFRPLGEWQLLEEDSLPKVGQLIEYMRLFCDRIEALSTAKIPSPAQPSMIAVLNAMAETAEECCKSLGYLARRIHVQRPACRYTEKTGAPAGEPETLELKFEAYVKRLELGSLSAGPCIELRLRDGYGEVLVPLTNVQVQDLWCDVRISVPLVG